ncbi:MAG: site-specific integrase [Eubacteriales bacterium]|nr:site-specific integrase [Eubacteriales bacterium]
MAHNLAYQFKSAIDSNFKEGTEKRSYKAVNGRKATGKIFSYAQRKDLIETSNNFAKYIKHTYPEVRKISDVRSEHVNSYLESKLGTCTSATIHQYATRLEKLQHVANGHFKTANATWKVTVPHIETVKMRDVAFSRQDYSNVMNSGSDCQSYRALDLAGRFGLRAQEVVKIRTTDIDYNNRTLHITGKGGRERYLPMRESDIGVLKEYTGRLRPGERLFTVKSDSVNSYLNRTCKNLGIERYAKCKSGVHAIRKMVAQERYDELREAGATKEEALTYVNNYLGHGDHRPDISNTYIENQW